MALYSFILRKFRLPISNLFFPTQPDFFYNEITAVAARKISEVFLPKKNHTLGHEDAFGEKAIKGKIFHIFGLIFCIDVSPDTFQTFVQSKIGIFCDFPFVLDEGHAVGRGCGLEMFVVCGDRIGFIEKNARPP